AGGPDRGDGAMPVAPGHSSARRGGTGAPRPPGGSLGRGRASGPRAAAADGTWFQSPSGKWLSFAQRLDRPRVEEGAHQQGESPLVGRLEKVQKTGRKRVRA